MEHVTPMHGVWGLPRALLFSGFALTMLASAASAADLGTSPPSPGADDRTHPFFTHRLLLQGGVAAHSINSAVQVRRAGASSGTNVAVEDMLGFDSNKASFDAMARLRIGDRWSVEFTYFDAIRSSSTSWHGTIEFGRLEFPANAAVSGDFDVRAYRLALGFAAYKSSDTEFGIGLSLFVHDFTVALKGSANIGGLAAGFQSEDYHVVAPLPAIGLFFHHAITPAWLVSARADYMDLSLDQISVMGMTLKDAGGRLVSFEANTEYRLAEHFAVGLGYRYQDVDFSATVSGLRGQIAYTTSSPFAFVRTSF